MFHSNIERAIDKNQKISVSFLYIVRGFLFLAVYITYNILETINIFLILLGVAYITRSKIPSYTIVENVD